MQRLREHFSGTKSCVPSWRYLKGEIPLQCEAASFRGWRSFEKISCLPLLEGEGGEEGKRANGKKCDLESTVAETRIPRKFLSF